RGPGGTSASGGGFRQGVAFSANDEERNDHQESGRSGRPERGPEADRRGRPHNGSFPADNDEDRPEEEGGGAAFGRRGPRAHAYPFPRARCPVALAAGRVGQSRAEVPWGDSGGRGGRLRSACFQGLL